MPRLSFWAAGVLIGVGGTYGGYYGVYVPRRAARLAADQRLEESKMPYQEVIHAYSRLRTSTEQQAAVAAALPASRAPGGTSSFATNAEKLLFFCELQSLRARLLALPRHFTTEKDLRGMLQQLTAWEAQHCTELNFRPAPLTTAQTLRSMACLALYLLCFRVLGPLLGAWSGGAEWRAQLQHRAAARIVETLEVQVRLTSKDDAARSSDSGGGDGVGAGRPVRRYVTLNATHWIEEVGFWACPNNPLLPQPPPLAPPSSGSGDSHGAPSPRIPSAAVVTCASTYAEHWRRVPTAPQERTRGGGSGGDGAPPLVTATDVSLGYPVLCDTSQLSADKSAPEALYQPVGVSGWQHLLYLDAAHANADVRPRLTRKETYARVQEAQFARAPVAPSARTTSTDTVPTLEVPRRSDWPAHRGLPCWCRVWWGGAYGGRGTGSRRSGAVLHYHIGPVSTAADYAAAAIAASQAAGTAAAEAAAL
ncbi:hypothetical protein NESM_000387200 [Novymonas esmeraldas]|uniref:Uncharacterized protein n=1 Tax=Novymonas esmeraldas TaxID=1808958 RepID=A0AAW0EN23_9TRYP